MDNTVQWLGSLRLEEKSEIKASFQNIGRYFMTVLFLVQMAYHITGNSLHEWLGTILFVLFVLHHILNRYWYKALFKGNYSAVRILMTIINVLLFAAMVGMVISGIMLSVKYSIL